MNMKRQVPCRWKPPPLTDSSSQIRLLWIYAGKEDEEIRCTVSVWDLEHAPRFRAISYTWGSPQPTAFINIQSVPTRPRRRAALRLYDMRVRVRENARYALWQARLHYPESYIWIDSVCINQTDLREKTAQVTMIAKIYGSAVAVLACICPSDESSDFVYRACKDQESIPESENYNAADSRLERLRAFMGAEPVNLLIEHFERLSLRSYFYRLWILQELHSGRDRLLLCGNLVAAWQNIAWLRKRLEDWRFFPRDDDYETDQIGHLHNLLKVHKGKGGLSSHPYHFWPMLEDFLCEDARDRVYGVLGMFDWDKAHIKKPLPDYETSSLELAARLIPPKDAISKDELEHLVTLLGLDKLRTSDLIQELNASRPLEQPAGFKLPEWHLQPHAICCVGQDSYGRLCAELSSRVVTETESADEAFHVLKSGIQLDGREDLTLPSSNGQEPVRIFTGGTVSVVAWPEVIPGDTLVQIADHVLVMRIVDTRHFRVVGHALVLNSFDWKRWEKWTCMCWTEEFGTYSKFGVILSSTDLSHAEAVALSTKSSDGFKLSSRVKRLRLSTPAIGSIFKDITNESYEGTGPHDGVRTIKGACALHNAEECNRWLDYPMRFAIASGCGPRVQQAHTIFGARTP